MRALCLAILTVVLVYAPTVAQAGFFEVSLTGNYRKSNFLETAYDVSQSITGSVSYYFLETSALELSYTDGFSKQYIPKADPAGNDRTTVTDYSMLGADLVFGFGTRESFLAPYVKIGMMKILEKKITERYNGFAPTTHQEENPIVPSVGAGFKLNITKTFGLKFGVDAWTSRSLKERPIRYDFAGRAGISWMF